MHYFFLGNTPALSLAELEAVTGLNPTLTTPEIATLDASNALTFAPRLGGTRKVASTLMVCSPTDLLVSLKNLIESLPNKNIALTDYAHQNLTKSHLHSLKSSITRPVRFVAMDTHEHELTMLSRQHVAELNFLPHPDGIAIAQTDWIFDASSWIMRDRAKPYRDIKHGMLPPKLARILANLALTTNPTQTLYDPFCGTGTILTEALLVGSGAVYGTDASDQAIKGAAANLNWATTQLGATGTYRLDCADATHPPYPSVDVIATEPYMGPLLDYRNPLPLSKIKDIARGLDKLYRGCFKAWAKILKPPSGSTSPGGRVVMTIPQFAVYSQIIPTISVDTITRLGYNYISSVAYGKPGATVIRNITILEKS